MAAESTAFRDLLEIPLRNGLTRPKRVRGAGVPMVNMGELFRHDRIGDIEMERVPLAEKSPERDLLEPGDLLFARQSLVAAGAGKVSLFTGASEPVTFESHLIRARPNPARASPAFLYYFFSSPQGKRLVQSIVNQVGAAGIRGSELADLQIPCPHPDEQHRIASVLGALDDKIESNRRLADRLDQTWLTQLGRLFAVAPPVAVEDLLGRGELYIGDGYRAKNSELSDTGAPFVRAGNLTAAGLVLDGADRAPPEVVRRAGAKVSQGWDTAFTSKGTVGRITLVGPAPTLFVYSPQVCFWRSRDASRLSPLILHAWMRSARFRAQVDAVKGQTDMADYVSLRDQRAMTIELPSPEEQQEAQAFAEPMARHAASLREEALTLSDLRDALLPKLVSGQIRVPPDDDVSVEDLAA